MKSLMFTLNRLDQSPWNKMKLLCNPFPKHGQAEMNRIDMKCNALESLASGVTGDMLPKLISLAGMSDEVGSVLLSNTSDGKIYLVKVSIDGLELDEL